MKMTKRLLSMLLALAMVCAIMPVGLTAAAEETAPVTEDIQLPEQAEPTDAETDTAGTQIPTVTEQGEIEPWVNPLYEGVIDESALKPYVPTSDPDASVQASYVSVSSAGTSLRSSMKNRTESVTLYVSHESSSYSTVLEEVLAVAIEHTGKGREGDYLNFHVAGFDGSYVRSYQNSTYKYTFELTFTYTTTAAQETQVTNAVSNLISSLGIRYKSDYEKISAVYAYMCENITYDYDHLEDPDYLLQFSAYGALIDKTAVCQGYALLFYRLMLELGVDCRMIVGVGGDAENNGPHAWNIVEINGLYYNVDTTWDAGYDEYVWFLNNTWNFIYHYRDLVYETMEFHTEYPMAAEDYDPNGTAEMDPYIYAGLCGDEAIWLLDREGGITITGSGAMYDHRDSTTGRPDWHYGWKSDITSVVVEEGITSIGNYTFTGIPNLASVTLPDGLEVIGNGAFKDCDSLTEIVIPSSVTTMSIECFQGCDGLVRAELNNSGSIGMSAFYGCENLSDLTIGENVTSIGSTAFQYCESLKELVLHENITSVGSSSFYGCRGLESVYLYLNGPIHAYAFASCSNMTTLVLGDGITYIGTCAFQSCGITEITIPACVTRCDFISGCSSLSTITFLGDAPEFYYYSFSSITATVYYPGGNDTWTKDIMQDYSGNITWVAVCDHSYEAVVTPPTCTEQGYTTYSCTLCVESYVADYTDPTGHTPGEVHAENEIPATCTEKGSYDSVTLCAVCGVEHGRETIIVDEIPHTPGEVHMENEVSATCFAKGSYENVTYCTACGIETSRETVETDLIPHTYTSEVTDPTCEEQGYTTHTCTVCGDSYVDSYISALGHTYENYTLTTTPSQTRTGELTGTCTRCDGTTTVVLPMLNEEDYTCEVTLAPTDDEDGAALYTWNITDYGTITFEVRLRKLSGLPIGDLNDDGEVDIFDANLIVAYYNGTATLDEDQLDAADVNGDGEVDIFDANLVVSYYNGTLDAFPAE